MGKVIVAGSVNMDVVANVFRHPVVGEQVIGKKIGLFPGGKGANQAISCARLGIKTFLIGKIGDDEFGLKLRDYLSTQGVSLDYLSKTSVAFTGTCLITVTESGQNTIVSVLGANNLLNSKDVESELIEKNDVLLSQLEIPDEVILSFFEAGKEKGALNVLNAAPARLCSKKIFSLADVIVLNESELTFFSKNRRTKSVKELESLCLSLRSNPKQAIIVTLGEKGLFALVGENTFRIPGFHVNVVDTTGAGDCFVGALSASLSKGTKIEDSLTYANFAASISVQRMGSATSMPSKEEVEFEMAKTKKC